MVSGEGMKAMTEKWTLLRKQRAKIREKGETGGMTRWGRRRTGLEEKVCTRREHGKKDAEEDCGTRVLSHRHLLLHITWNS